MIYVYKSNVWVHGDKIHIQNIWNVYIHITIYLIIYLLLYSAKIKEQNTGQLFASDQWVIFHL